MNIKVTDVRVDPGDSAFLLDDGKTAILYDTGFGFTGFAVAEKIKEQLGARNLDYIFLTHSHYDHALGSAYILQVFPDAKVVASLHTAEVFKRPGAKKVMQDLDAKHAAACGITDYPFLGEHLRVDIVVQDGDIVQAGEYAFEVLSLPGHTHCSIGFYLRSEKLLLACESLGVYDGKEQVLPSILVGCDLCLQSIDKVCALDVKKLIAPHSGLLTEEQTRFYLTHCRQATEDMIELISQGIREEQTDEQILAMLTEKYRHGHLESVYPKNAANLNTGIMIRRIRKEKFGQE